MTRPSLIVACLIAVSIPALAWQEAPGDADAMLKELNSLRAPAVDMTRQNDQAYVQSFIAERNAFLQKRAELIKGFFEKFPNHPQAMPLMQERWMMLAQLGQPDEVKTEIDKLLASEKDPKKQADLLYPRAMAMMRSPQRDPAAITEAVEQFVKAAPTDQRGGQLLYQVAQFDPSKQAQIMKRIVADYPGSQAAQRAQGTLRQTDGIGKPFELSFTEAITGKQMSMADLKGKVVVIDFWATWCGPCVAEMPKMKQLYAEYKAKGVEFIGVSLDQPETAGGLTKLKAFVKENGIEWPQYYQGNGWQSEFSASWGINSIPSVFIVDADGKLHSVDARGQLETLIPQLLAKRSGKSA